MAEIVDDGAFDGVDEPFARWCTLITYPANAGHKFAGLTTRMRGDGSRRMAEMRRDWHQANGATAVLQRQAWTPSPWTDVSEAGEAGSEATPDDLPGPTGEVRDA
jgi:hypothetical protein